MWLQIIAFQQEQSFIIIYHVLSVSEIIQRETISFKKVVDGQVTCFWFLFKEFYSELSKHAHHQNPMANCCSKHMEPFIQRLFPARLEAGAEGPRGPGLLPRSSLLIHNSQSQLSKFPKKIPTGPLQHPQVPSKYKYEKISSESLDFLLKMLTFIWSHEVSC